MQAVFLDRDGVINALVYHPEAGVIDSPSVPAQFRLLPRVPQAIRVLNGLDLRVVVVSNQPGIAKRRFGPKTLKMLERKMLAAIEAAGGRIDRIYYCLHHPEAKVKALRKRCRCRKPKIGMLERAATELELDLAQCYMVGDGIPDILAGARAGCRTIFVGHWKCEICQYLEPPGLRPDLAVKDLWEASQVIKQEIRSGTAMRVAPEKRWAGCHAQQER